MHVAHDETQIIILDSMAATIEELGIGLSLVSVFSTVGYSGLFIKSLTTTLLNLSWLLLEVGLLSTGLDERFTDFIVVMPLWTLLTVFWLMYKFYIFWGEFFLFLFGATYIKGLFDDVIFSFGDSTHSPWNSMNPLSH